MNARNALLSLLGFALACSGGAYRSDSAGRSTSTQAPQHAADTAVTAEAAAPAPAGTSSAAPPAGTPSAAPSADAAPAPRSTAPARHHNHAESSAGSAHEPVARERPRQPEERPGLGTVWGETVTSHARSKPFVRAASSPFARVALYYNDAEGVRAHSAYRGSGSLAPFRAHTPHGGISVALTDVHGNVLSGGMAGGRALIVGAEGQRYNIVVHNHTAGRYEVVTSVDGLDVIDGRPADLAKRGYILEPHSTLTIDGFRRSESAVAAFRFGRVSQSYAARTSGDRNVGVVGLAFFAERGSVWTSDELYRRDTADPFPGDRSYARPPR